MPITSALDHAFSIKESGFNFLFSYDVKTRQIKFWFLRPREVVSVRAEFVKMIRDLAVYITTFRFDVTKIDPCRNFQTITIASLNARAFVADFVLSKHVDYSPIEPARKRHIVSAIFAAHLSSARNRQRTHSTSSVITAAITQVAANKLKIKIDVKCDLGSSHCYHSISPWQSATL